MGRQIGFYFSHEDEEIFLKEKLSDLDIVFISPNSEQNHYKIYEYINIELFTKDFTSQTFMCFRDDLHEIKMSEIERNEYYRIREIVSPVIEFDRSGYLKAKNILVSGRIWFELKYWDEDENGNDILRTKSDKLLKLYNSLERWIRRYCKRLPNGNYIAPNAEKLLKETGAELSS